MKSNSVMLERHKANGHTTRGGFIGLTDMVRDALADRPDTLDGLVARLQRPKENVRSALSVLVGRTGGVVSVVGVGNRRVYSVFVATLKTTTGKLMVSAPGSHYATDFRPLKRKPGECPFERAALCLTINR